MRSAAHTSPEMAAVKNYLKFAGLTLRPARFVMPSLPWFMILAAPALAAAPQRAITLLLAPIIAYLYPEMRRYFDDLLHERVPYRIVFRAATPKYPAWISAALSFAESMRGRTGAAGATFRLTPARRTMGDNAGCSPFPEFSCTSTCHCLQALPDTPCAGIFQRSAWPSGWSLPAASRLRLTRRSGLLKRVQRLRLARPSIFWSTRQQMASIVGTTTPTGYATPWPEPAANRF